MPPEQLNTCYREGFNARVCGAKVGDSPYRCYTPEHGCWAEGWLDADDHLNKRDEALESIGWFGPAKQQ